MNADEIYKIYKHGGSFKHKNLSSKKIFRALKIAGLQAVKVIDNENIERVYNYIPEIDKFELVY